MKQFKFNYSENNQLINLDDIIGHTNLEIEKYDEIKDEIKEHKKTSFNSNIENNTEINHEINN